MQLESKRKIRDLLSRSIGNKGDWQEKELALNHWKVHSEKQSLRIDALEAKITELKIELEKYSTWVPPGHFYSPIPDLDKIRKSEVKIFDRKKRSIPGIDLREEAQVALLKEISAHYPDLPYKKTRSEVDRYYYENPAYSYTDAMMLGCMIQYLKPKRIIEVGSGYSSCAMMDINEYLMGGSIELTFIEPYPELLSSLIKEGDLERINILADGLEDVDPKIFRQLEAGDILFIDSTHVSKINSDVNFLFFTILPMLNKGVYVHIHDIFYPFEYSAEWIYEGRAWNELYLLKAFLQYNNVFRIEIWGHYLYSFYPELFRRLMPMSTPGSVGNIWLKKINE